MGESIARKESWEKVTGTAKYTDDIYDNNMLYARLKTSEIAHGNIILIDTSKAEQMPGVKAILTGKSHPYLSGVLVVDRPLLAIDKVRYYGEPVAMVVATSEHEATNAANAINVQYEPLPVLSSITESLAQNAPLVHDKPDCYAKMEEDIYPTAHTNIASTYRIKKGDMDIGWSQSEVVVEASFQLPQSDHAAMETRIAKAQIMPDGNVHIHSSSQSPFTIKEMMSNLFQIEDGKIQVHVPLVGGGFGGKAPVQLELLSYIASSAVGGRMVRIANTREEDMATSPSRLGMEATVKLGATKGGIIKAAQLIYHIDSGAYTDISPYMSKAAAVNCTGPYNIENVDCESMTVYTNHTYSTSFRGFAHEAYTFCIERTIELLAQKCDIDPLELRMKNAIKEGDYSPTQVKITKSNTGNLTACIEKLKNLINWDEGIRIDMGESRIRAKGMSCLWKCPTSPTDASAGAVITFNKNGSINLNTGVIEMGSGAKTTLAHILAEKLKMNVDRIHVNFNVDTLTSPKYWKTVGSMSSYLAGRAVVAAADDVIRQLKLLASIALRSPVEDLEIANEKVFLKHLPEFGIGFQDLVYGLVFPDGNAIGGQVIGRGSFIMNHLSKLDPQTGKGKTGSAWTLGAQAVEVEIDTVEFTYRIIKAATVMDIGNVLDQNHAECVIRSSMSMGLGLASREEFIYDNNGILQNTSLRNYKLLHIGQEPQYLIDFVETPQEDSPYGIRAFSEHGVIGIPAALANALSCATNVSYNFLPLTPEKMWRASQMT